MLDDNNKVWMHYVGILAADAGAARFLSRYMRFLMIHRGYLKSVEVIDLQRYKLIKSSSRKLRQYVNERLHVPFVFLCCNN